MKLLLALLLFAAPVEAAMVSLDFSYEGELNGKDAVNVFMGLKSDEPIEYWQLLQFPDKMSQDLHFVSVYVTDFAATGHIPSQDKFQAELDQFVKDHPDVTCLGSACETGILFETFLKSSGYTYQNTYFDDIPKQYPGFEPHDQVAKDVRFRYGAFTPIEQAGASVVPEPSTLFLLPIGLLGLSRRMGRRRNA